MSLPLTRFARLLAAEPGIFDYFMSLNQADGANAADLFVRLADFVVGKAFDGLSTAQKPLNPRANHALRGLTYAPMLPDRHRGLLLEWMVVQLAQDKNAEEEAQERRRLATLRQFLRQMAQCWDPSAGPGKGKVANSHDMGFLSSLVKPEAKPLTQRSSPEAKPLQAQPAPTDAAAAAPPPAPPRQRRSCSSSRGQASGSDLESGSPVHHC